jgi:hypothetical protein
MNTSYEFEIITQIKKTLTEKRSFLLPCIVYILHTYCRCFRKLYTVLRIDNGIYSSKAQCYRVLALIKYFNKYLKSFYQRKYSLFFLAIT